MDESVHSSSYFALILSRVKSYLSYQEMQTTDKHCKLCNEAKTTQYPNTQQTAQRAMKTSVE